MNNTTHNKIAHWILEQEVSRGIKSADIREIGKMIFGLELTSRDIKKIKEALEGLGYDRILDAKPYNSTQEKADAIIEYYNDGGNAPRHVEYVLTKLFGDKYDNVKYLTEINLMDLAKVYDYMKKYYQKEINNYPKSHEVPTKAFNIFGLIQRDIKDSKDTSSITFIYPGAILYEIGYGRVPVKVLKVKKGDLNDIYVETKAGVRYWTKSQNYAGANKYFMTPEEYNRKFKDTKFKDERLEPTAENAWRHLSQYRYKYGSYMDAFLEMVFRFKLTNYEINALIDRALDREYIDEYEVEKCKDYVKDVFDENGNIKGELLKAFLGDAKLTRRQKLWYAEELEKFIHPQYLRKNYQLKRLKRRVK